MERWKVVFALDYHSRKLSPKRLSTSILPHERGAVIRNANVDAAYDCRHRLVGYKLRPDEAELYALPRPVCPDCRGEMELVSLWDEGD